MFLISDRRSCECMDFDKLALIDKKLIGGRLMGTKNVQGIIETVAASERFCSLLPADNWIVNLARIGKLTWANKNGA